MSLRDLERAIWYEAKIVLCNKKLRFKDIMEWSSGKIDPHQGEVVVYLPDMAVYVAVSGKDDKRSNG